MGSQSGQLFHAYWHLKWSTIILALLEAAVSKFPHQNNAKI